MTEATAIFAIVTGGGTAGHVNPALAIADALVAAGHRADTIHYVGSARGIEATIMPPTGYPMTLLPGRGIQRRLTVANVQAVAGLLLAGYRAMRLLGRLRPQVVVAVGGYASVAVGVAAVLRRVPLVVAEQNLAPGAANRLLARFANVSAVAFPGTPLPRAVVTGNPIRQDITALSPERDRAAARRAFGTGEGRQVLLVFGGSLGARRLNEAVVAALPSWRDRANLAVHHVVGTRDWDTMSAATPSDSGALEYRQVIYEKDMAGALAAADLAVCRSGSSTCFELAAAGLPAVLVPSPFVTADQQTSNAGYLVEAGAAVMVPDRTFDAARLVAEVDALLADEEGRMAMGRAALTRARPHAAAAIAALAREHSRG